MRNLKFQNIFALVAPCTFSLLKDLGKVCLELIFFFSELAAHLRRMDFFYNMKVS